PLAAHQLDRRAPVPPVDEGAGDGDRRLHVAGRAAPGDQGEGAADVAAAPAPHRSRSGGRGGKLRTVACRATESSSPAPAMATTRDDPPALTKGNGTPVMGRMPITAPMLSNAWLHSQAVTPTARSSPKRSGACREIGRASCRAGPE